MRLIGAAFLAFVAAITVASIPEIKRYLKIKQM
jgi:hypothetical protein